MNCYEIITSKLREDYLEFKWSGNKIETLPAGRLGSRRILTHRARRRVLRSGGTPAIFPRQFGMDQARHSRDLRWSRAGRRRLLLTPLPRTLRRNREM